MHDGHAGSPIGAFELDLQSRVAARTRELPGSPRLDDAPSGQELDGPSVNGPVQDRELTPYARVDLGCGAGEGRVRAAVEPRGIDAFRQAGNHGGDAKCIGHSFFPMQRAPKRSTKTAASRSATRPSGRGAFRTGKLASDRATLSNFCLSGIR